jgi:hypothetical protein
MQTHQTPVAHSLTETPFLTRVFNTQAETEAFASALAQQARCQDLIRLKGDLGTGKSVIARAFVQGLGNTEPVPSPTYTLMQTYEAGRLPVAHLDCYRLSDPEEALALGLEAYRTHGVVLVEWPEKAGDMLSHNIPDLIDYFHCTMDNAGVLTIHLRALDENRREVELYCNPAWQRRLGEVFPDLQRPVTEIGRQQFMANQGWRGHVLTCASGKEAWSTRSYWRFKTDDGSKLLMDAPPPLQELGTFLEVGTYLHSHNSHSIKVPALDLAHSAPEKGYLVLEDFGDRILQKEPQDTPEFFEWVTLAVDMLAELTKLPKPTWRTYTRQDMWLEAARLTDYYLPHITGHATTPELRQQFYDLLQPLFNKIQAVPYGFMHSDYHAGNLLLLADKAGEDLHNLGLIDFQDASCGPITYDVASFIRNDRVPLTQEQEETLRARFIEKAGVEDVAAFDASFDLIIMQRMFKIIGGATKLAVRKNRLDILALLPRCWAVVDDVLERRDDCKQLKDWFKQHVPRKKV